jgi:hypothetical protein
VEDLYRLEHVRNDVGRAVILIRPRLPVNPDRTKTGGLSPANVGNRVVTDHPSPIGKEHATPPGGDLEQTNLRLTDAFEP